MAFTYDPRTPAGQVRLMIFDTDAANALFSDEEIDAILELESGSVRYAAAQALEIIAVSEVLIQKRIKLLDLQTDGPAEAEALRDLAERYRQTENNIGTFDVAEMVAEPFGRRERVWNQFLRNRY